jgi:stearoyl-CoA desaturase (delta-9 desaturase)
MISRNFTKFLMLILTTLALLNFNLELLVVALILGWFMGGIVVSVLLHRKISHRLFEFKNNFAKWTCYSLLLMSGHSSPIGWGGVHRLHHSKTDTMDDPQSPHSVGKLKTFFSIYWLKSPNPRQMIDMLKDKELVFIHKYYNHIFALYAAALFVINPLYCFYLAGVAPAVCLLFPGFINTFAHDDYTRADNTMAKNFSGIFFLILFWGENLHKDHHIDPTKVRYHKYDLGYFFIRLLGRTHDSQTK